jgi:hypothetical protein
MKTGAGTVSIQVTSGRPLLKTSVHGYSILLQYHRLHFNKGVTQATRPLGPDFKCSIDPCQPALYRQRARSNTATPHRPQHGLYPRICTPCTLTFIVMRSLSLPPASCEQVMRDFVSPAAQQSRDIGAVNVRWGYQWNGGSV